MIDKTDRTARNALIFERYVAGVKMSIIAREVALTRSAVLNILRREGKWEPYVKSHRSDFLGITLAPETKEKLRSAARHQGTSMSKLTADVLDNLLSLLNTPTKEAHDGTEPDADH